MADFSFRLRADVSTEEARRRLQGLEGDVQELNKAIGDLTDSTGTSTNQLNIDIVTTEKGKGTIGRVTQQVVTLDKAEQDRIKTLQKKTSVEQGSLTSLRQSLNVEKQLKNALAPGTAAYQQRVDKIAQLEAAVRRAQGVQDGSVAAIRAEGKALLEQLNNQNLSIAQREKLTQAINSNAEAERRAQGIQSGSIADLRAQQAEYQRLAESLRVGTAEQIRAQQAADELGNRIAALTPKTTSFIGQLNKLATIQAGIQAITAIFGQIAGSIDKVVKRIKEVEAFDLALRNLGVSASDSAAAFSQAANTANALGAPIQQVEKAYKRITPALRDIGASAAESDRFIENLTARTQVLGLTTEESGRLQEAFAQVLAKGKLQAEELTQQIAEVDGAFRTQFAEALGITSAELQELTKNGQITSQVFVKGVNAMNNGVDLLKGNIESGNATIQQLQNLIANINLKSLEEIGRQIEPGIRAFLEAGRVFAEFVRTVIDSPVGQLLGDTFNQVAGATKNFITALTGLLTVLLQIISPIAALLRLFSPLIGVFVFFVATLKTAGLALTAYKAVLAATTVVAGQKVTAINLAAQAIVRFGTAIKSLLALDVKGFFTQLAGSAVKATEALVGGDIVKLKDALKNLTGAGGTAGKTLSSLVGNVNKVGGAGSAVTPVVSSLSNAIGNAGKISTTFGATSTNLAAGLASTAKAASGSIPSLTAHAGAIGNMALASKLAGGATGALGTAATSLTPAMVTVGTATAGAGAAAGGAAVGFGALLIAALPFVAIAAAVIAAIAALSMSLNSFGQAGKLSGGAMRQLSVDLKKLGTETKPQKSAWQQFTDAFVRSNPVLWATVALFEKIQLGLQKLGFAKQTAELRAVVQQVDADFKKAGLGGLTDFANASKLTGKEAANLVGKLGALAKSQDEVAASIQREIDEKKRKNSFWPGEQANLEKELELAKERSAGFQILQRQLAAATAEQRQAALAENDYANAVDITKAALEKKSAQIEQAQQVLDTKSTQDYNNGLITEAQLELNTGAAAVAASKQKLAAIDQEIQANKKAVQADAKDSLQQVNQKQQLAEELKAKRIEAEAAVAEAQKAYRAAEIARIQEVIKNAEELAGIYLDTASSASSALNDLGSSVGTALQGISDAITQQSALEFSITGDDAIIQRAVDAQGKILAFEYTIGKVKNEIAQKQREAELQLQQLKLQGLLAEAQADPNAESRERRVAALQNALALTQQIGALQATQAAAENIALDAQTQKQQQALNAQREALGLPPIKIVDEKSVDQLSSDFDNLYQQATTQAQGIGAATTGSVSQGIAAGKAGVEELGNTVNTIKTQQEEFNKKLTEGVTALGEAAKELANTNYGVKLGEELKKALGGAFDSFNESLKNAPKLTSEVAKGAEGIGKGFEGVNDRVGKLNGTLDSTAGKLRTLQGLSKGLPGGSTPGSMAQALATGGPVTAGSQYFVNDGGGREAFVDMQGRTQLLPAARNIHWRAPRDGYVLPAPMTSELIQNSKINAKIQAAANQGRPRLEASGYASGMSSSGNLIKQMGAMMTGGNTQRITNNVTIQSQNPVMDASKIMANVARMKARRGML